MSRLLNSKERDKVLAAMCTGAYSVVLHARDKGVKQGKTNTPEFIKLNQLCNAFHQAEYLLKTLHMSAEEEAEIRKMWNLSSA